MFIPCWGGYRTPVPHWVALARVDVRLRVAVVVEVEDTVALGVSVPVGAEGFPTLPQSTPPQRAGRSGLKVDSRFLRIALGGDLL